MGCIIRFIFTTKRNQQDTSLMSSNDERNTKSVTQLALELPELNHLTVIDQTCGKPEEESLFQCQ